MTDYFVGDLQGCFDELDLLLRKIRFNHQKDHLYLVGDLIGRGPQAQETLDFLISHQSSIHPILGNHDLHFLAICHGIKKSKASDKYQSLLNSPQRQQYINYLRNLPLLIDFPNHNVVMSHAGISPQWDLTTAKKEAKKVEQWLKSNKYNQLLTAMYNNQINDWQQCNTVTEKAVFTINSLTRMRYCNANNQLDFTVNSSPFTNSNTLLSPWFQSQTILPAHYRCVFGHWASLSGHTNDPKFVALDTGCLWGEHLTAWDIKTNQFFQQKSLQ